VKGRQKRRKKTYSMGKVEVRTRTAEERNRDQKGDSERKRGEKERYKNTGERKVRYDGERWRE
jgi:hypothetical protein